MRLSNADIWSSPGDRSRAFPGLSVSHPTRRHWEVLMLVDSEAAAWVSGAAETVDYFG